MVSSTKVAIESFLQYEHNFFKTMEFNRCIGNLIVQIRDMCFHFGLILNFKLWSPHIWWLDFFLQDINLMFVFSWLRRNFWSKFIWIWPVRWNFDGPKIPEKAFTLDRPRSSISCFWVLPAAVFHQTDNFFASGGKLTSETHYIFVFHQYWKPDR